MNTKRADCIQKLLSKFTKFRLTIGVEQFMLLDVMNATRPVLPVLGELERAILRFLWRAGDADVVQAHAAVAARRNISVNTVGSALERLYRKGLVSRWKVSHAFRYRPALNRENFAVRQLADSVGGLRTLASSGLLASFLDLVTGADKDALDELERLIAKKRRESKS